MVVVVVVVAGSAAKTVVLVAAVCSHLLLPPQHTLKAAKRLATQAEMRADQAKSSSLTEARQTPPITGMRQSHLAFEICFPYTV